MKGLAYLLEAVAKIRTERPCDLVIIGKPKEEGRAMRTLEQYGLTDAVQWVYGVSDERIVELYAEAELAVVPSLYEGFSLPAIEAQCSGVPLVATTGGALREVVGPDGETAFTCPPGDAAALAARITFAMDDPELADQGRRRRPSAGHRQLDLAPHGREDRRAVPHPPEAGLSRCDRRPRPPHGVPDRPRQGEPC